MFGLFKKNKGYEGLVRLFDDTVRVEKEPKGNKLKGDNYRVYELKDKRFIEVDRFKNYDEAMSLAKSLRKK